MFNVMTFDGVLSSQTGLDGQNLLVGRFGVAVKEEGGPKVGTVYVPR